MLHAVGDDNREVWLLEKSYNPYLIMLSMTISFLGAHTTTQYIRFTRTLF